MAVNPMLSSGISGISQGVNSLQNVAQEIASLNTKSNPSDADAAPAPSVDEVAESVVELKVYQRQVEAGVKVVQTADEVIGFLLDVTA